VDQPHSSVEVALGKFREAFFKPGGLARLILEEAVRVAPLHGGHLPQTERAFAVVNDDRALKSFRWH
jgi:hypothetical protein